VVGVVGVEAVHQDLLHAELARVLHEDDARGRNRPAQDDLGVGPSNPRQLRNQVARRRIEFLLLLASATFKPKGKAEYASQ